jgi:hypothetical protein
LAKNLIREVGDCLFKGCPFSTKSCTI